MNLWIDDIFVAEFETFDQIMNLLKEQDFALGGVEVYSKGELIWSAARLSRCR